MILVLLDSLFFYLSLIVSPLLLWDTLLLWRLLIERMNDTGNMGVYNLVINQSVSRHMCTQKIREIDDGDS